MNVLFMSLGVFYDLSSSSVHIDILKRFANEHNVFLVCINEGGDTQYNIENGINVLRVHTGELKNVNTIRKGINTVFVEYQFARAIKKYLGSVAFDLVLYTTPPITFVRPISYIKNRNNAVTYLMLKDIFPQNAVDIGLMSTAGISGVIYKYFRSKEKKLYEISDYIGCMSKANVDYIISQNKEVDKNKVEICPNITFIEDLSLDAYKKEHIRTKYNIPLEKVVFVYGGNLGKPQGIPFLIECLQRCSNYKDSFFLIIGQGTEYGRIRDFLDKSKLSNCILLDSLPKKDYETLVAACDVGLIFLDHRFTIPNFPSRVLSYMKAKVPVLAATDPNTDIGQTIIKGRFGWWCESNNSMEFQKRVSEILDNRNNLSTLGENGFYYMKKNYNPDIAYQTIVSKC